jgi:hypothetical protein
LPAAGYPWKEAGEVKPRIVTFLAAAVTTIVGAVGPVSAQTSTGTSLKIETSIKQLSGTTGDYVELPAMITNTSNKPVEGVVAYVTLVDTTQGQQTPVDLEDWSAQRAVTIDSLAPGETRNASWSLRLIKGGDYVVYPAAIAKDSSQPSVGPEVPLSVTSHQSLNPGGVLPVALGVPILAGVALFEPVIWRRRNLTA